MSDIIYETGELPKPKGRYRVEVLNSDGQWRELEDHDSPQSAIQGAKFQAPRRHTMARVRDSHFS